MRVGHALRRGPLRWSVLPLLLGLLSVGWAATVLELTPLGWLPRSSTWWEFLAKAWQPSLRSVESGGFDFGALLNAIGWTIAFASSGMSLALILAALLALPALPLWWSGPIEGPGRLGRAVRLFAQVVAASLRSVHELLWAMLLLSAWGVTPWTATLAIALPYAGTLSKVLLEMTEEADTTAMRRLEESGACRWAQLLWGWWPALRDDFAAYCFYRFECGLRSAAILGFFGFPTLGYSIALALENLHYARLWGQLYVLLGLAAAMELWSSKMRWRAWWSP